MAKFCTKCGSPVEEALKFCPKCGNALAAAAAPAAGAAAPPPTPAPSAPPAAAAAAPAATSGSPILKIVLIVLGVIVLFSMLGIGACVVIAYKARQKLHQYAESARTATQSVGTPEVHAEKGGQGSEAAAAPVPDDLAYPGATATESGGNMSFGGIGVSGQEYETSDPVDKVVSFYKDKLGPKAMLQETGGKATLTLMASNGMTTVIIEREEGADKTKISISRIKK